MRQIAAERAGVDLDEPGALEEAVKDGIIDVKGLDSSNS